MQDKVIKKMDAALSDYLFKQREEEFVHATLSQEMSSFELVKNGEISALKKALVRYRKKTFSKLSESPLQQQSLPTTMMMCFLEKTGTNRILM